MYSLNYINLQLNNFTTSHLQIIQKTERIGTTSNFQCTLSNTATNK